MIKSNTNLKQVMLFTVFSIFISVFTAYVPAFMFLSFLFGAFFVVIGYISQNKTYIIVSIALLIIFDIILLDTTDTFFWSSMVALPCLYTGYSLKNSDNEHNSYLLSTVLISVAFIIFYKIFVTSLNIDFWKVVNDSFAKAINAYNTTNSNSFIANATPEKLTNTLKSIFPAIIVISSMIFVLITKFMGISLLKNILKLDTSTIIPFREFVIPQKIGFFFMSFYLIFLIMSYTKTIDSNYSKILTNNVIYIFSYMLLIQGLAILVFALHRIKNKFTKNLVIVVTILFFSYINIPLIFLAIIDMIVDFRKLGFRSIK